MARFPVEDLNWLPEYQVPPKIPANLLLPRMAGFQRRAAGRAGDILVVQIKSERGLQYNQRETLRSLSLRGPGTFSLRRFDDPVTRGYIETVREIVSVLDLGGVEYKNDNIVAHNLHDRPLIKYEANQYGTNSRPSRLIRDEASNYFQVETSAAQLSLKWNTQKDQGDCLHEFFESFSESKPLPRRGVLGLSAQAKLETDALDADRISVSIDEQGTALLIGPSDELIAVADAHRSTVQFSRFVMDRRVEFTWRDGEQKFEDRKRIMREVGVLATSGVDLVATRRFADATGDQDFFAGADFDVEIRINGALRTFQF